MEVLSLFFRQYNIIIVCSIVLSVVFCEFDEHRDFFLNCMRFFFVWLNCICRYFASHSRSRALKIPFSVYISYVCCISLHVCRCIFFFSLLVFLCSYLFYYMLHRHVCSLSYNTYKLTIFAILSGGKNISGNNSFFRCSFFFSSFSLALSLICNTTTITSITWIKFPALIVAGVVWHIQFFLHLHGFCVFLFHFHFALSVRNEQKKVFSEFNYFVKLYNSMASTHGIRQIWIYVCKWMYDAWNT